MIVIAGKNDIAVHGLKLALKYFKEKDISVIVNKNDSGHDEWQRSLLKAAKENNVSVRTLEEIYDSNIDMFISLEFDRIVDSARISTTRIYNIHFSILPKYKGMFTSVWPILFGDRKSGVTLHKIDRGIDTGDIVAQQTFLINDNDRSQDCYRKYIDTSKKLLTDYFSRLIDNVDIVFIPQSAEFSTYFSNKAIDFSDIEIDLNQTAWNIKRQVYAFSFRPYQLVYFQDKAISDVVITNVKSSVKPGEVVGVFQDYFLISTIDLNVKLFFDNFNNELDLMPTISVKDFRESVHRFLGINDKNEKGWSPIIVAAYHGRKDIIEFLLERGANINDRNYRGTTVLMYAKDYALRSKDYNIISFLLDKGADSRLRDWSGKTVYDYISTEETYYLGL
ncbi:formyltransferase family protein [Oceanisphaera sp. IT1-181]|uniref:formyltransferase family protein n=1 Tax=Oceanisphaera sp. IT1-181 TaxID=3081199 RepID=UPI0029CAAA95|nr:formyltransferase family protein [Oceanisphaera sp. IT1-181]